MNVWMRYADLHFGPGPASLANGAKMLVHIGKYAL